MQSGNASNTICKILQTIALPSGSVLEIVAENGCTQFLLKGAVRHNAGWVDKVTEVTVSAKAGATITCQGKSFPAAKAMATSRNG